MTFAMRQKKEQSKGKQPTFTQTWIITESQIEAFGAPKGPIDNKILKGPVWGTYYGHYCLRPPPPRDFVVYFLLNFLTF